MTDAEFDEITAAVSEVVPGASFRQNVDGFEPLGLVTVRHGSTRYVAPFDEAENKIAPFLVTTLAETKSRAIAAAEELRAFLDSLH